MREQIKEHNTVYNALVFGSACETLGIKFEDYEEMERPFSHFYRAWYTNNKGLKETDEEYMYFSAFLKKYLTQETFNDFCK